MTKVLVYIAKNCPWCDKTKEFLKKNKIKFQEEDVDSNEKLKQDAIIKSGQMGVPVIDIDGKIIVGFNPEEIKKALKNNHH